MAPLPLTTTITEGSHEELLQRLRKVTETEQAKSFEGLEAIYTFLQEKFEGKELQQHAQAPFFLLKYAVESIAFPEMQWVCAVDLLAVLAQVERKRRSVVRLARFALSLDEVAASERFAGARPGMLRDAAAAQLAPRDRATLRWIADKDRSTRLKYRIVVLHICNRHIIWARARPDESHVVASLLSKYFPAAHDAKLEMAIHSELTDDELKERDQFREGALAFIKSALDWEKRRKDYYAAVNPKFDIHKEDEFSSYTRDFEAYFQPSFRWWRVMDALQNYMERVADMVRDYETLFPNGTYVPSTDE